VKSRYIFLLVLCLGLTSTCYAFELTHNTEGDAIVIPDEAQEQPKDDSWSAKAQEIMMSAFSLTGVKYRYGGNSPETGFDCSGFVRYVFSQAVNMSLPPTARAISQVGRTVKKEDLQPGDLVFFNTLKKSFSHVGIYIGDNKFIHAPSKGSEVRVEDMSNSYWVKRFNGAQRMDNTPDKSPSAANSH
jgi:cell wall-associated NlpC family hydrolase